MGRMRRRRTNEGMMRDNDWVMGPSVARAHRLLGGWRICFERRKAVVMSIGRYREKGIREG